jgi:hypothetical protein
MLSDYARLDRRVLKGSQTARSTLYPVILFLGRPLVSRKPPKRVAKCNLASFCRKTIESKMSYIDFQDTLPLLCVSLRKMNLYGGWVKPLRTILGGFLRPDRAGFAENAWELA